MTTPHPLPPWSIVGKSPEPQAEGRGVQQRSECDENSLAVSLLIGLEHRRTARPFSELALKYGLSPEAAAMALSQAMGDMALALGSYHRDIDIPLPGPVPHPVRNRKGTGR